MKKTLTLLFSCLLGVCVITAFFLSQSQQEAARLRSQILEQGASLEELQAEVDGLREANSALHILLARLRSAPRGQPSGISLSPATEQPEAPAEIPVGVRPSGVENMDPVPLEPTPLPPPPAAMTFTPNSRPTPSPQLLKMMEQFPEIDREAVFNQSNTIEEYLKVNPHIREELNQPQGRYGSGIQAVLEQYPDLAEKLREAERLAGETP